MTSKTHARTPLLSDKIANYVATFDLAQTPPEVIEAARVGIIDTIGVMLAGSREEVSEIVCKMVAEENSSPEATIIGHKQRTSLQSAALANGVAAHAMDYDFIFARGQAVCAVIPALLPLAQARDGRPDEFLSAFIIACEVAARVVRACQKISAVGGWTVVGVVGPIAAGVGCARLLKLDASRIVDVVGMAASLASGVTSNYGTMTKPLHAGNAARSGMMAALLGARGFTASVTALEGANGYFANFGRDLETDFSAFDDFGRVHNLIDPGYKLKRYPCGGLSHGSIDAVLALRDQLLDRLDDIAKIEVGISRYAFGRIKGHYPESIESAKFSMPYLGAWSLLYGPPTLAAFTEASLEDARIKVLAAKISHHVDPEFADELDESPARVKVKLKGGETFEKLVWYMTGSRKNPMSLAQIEAKFLDCAKQAVAEDQAKKTFAWLSDLPNQTSFAELWSLLGAT